MGVDMSVKNSLMAKLKRGGTLLQEDKDKPLVNNETLTMLNTPSFVDLLPVKQDCGDSIFYFRDLKNVGAMFSIEPINIEAKNALDKQEILDGINFSIKQAIPAEYNELWHSQIFVTKVDAKKSTFNAIKKHGKVDTKFSKHWLEQIDRHLTELSNPNGAFVDKNTSLKFKLSKLKVTMCLWQELSDNNKETLEQRFNKTKETLERLISSFEQSKLKINPFDSQEYIDNISSFVQGRKVNYNPSALQMVDSDLSQEALKNTLISCSADGVFTFSDRINNNTIHSTYLAVEKISLDPSFAHIVGEQKDRTSLFDKLPIGSTWVQNVVHMHPDLVIEQLKIIKDSVLGTSAKAEKSIEAIMAALDEIGSGNHVYRFAAGVYLSTDSKLKMDKLIRDTKSILGSKGVEVLSLADNPMSQQDFVASLPFSFSYKKDNLWYNKRAFLQDLNLISKLAPVAGRASDVGSPGLLKFNRGGEPLMFDPLADRVNNAYGLVLGPMGSGKSAFLVDFLLNMTAIYNPRIFIIEKGNSFGLFTDHCKNMGMSTNKISITAGSTDVKLPPFADATKLLDKKDDGVLEDRDLLGELLIIAKLMITGGEEKEEEKFERGDWDTMSEAIKLAAQITKDDNRGITLTEDVVNALDQLSNKKTLLDEEKIRIRKMTKAMRVFINTDFTNNIFNKEGEMFPEKDVTLLDVGILGDEGYQDKLAVAFISMMSSINRIAEKTQYDDRPILILVDEAHLITANPLLAPYIVKIAKMWRKLGAWLWLATQSLDDYKDASAQMLKVMEWWVCLSFKPAEVESMKRFKKLTPEQEDLLLSAVNASGQYKEGVVFGENTQTLIRNIPPSLSLALAQTEDHEKSARRKIMNELNCSEIEAVYKIADDISKSRSGPGI